MTHEGVTVEAVTDEETFVDRAREIFQTLQAVDPDKVRCMLGVVVTNPTANETQNTVRTFALGNGEDLAKMFSSLVTITRNGIVRANTPPTHNDEVKH